MEAARRFTIVVLLVWFATAFTVGALGRVNQPGTLPTVLLGFLLGPTTLFVVAYFASQTFRAFTNGLSLTLLVGSHLWRFVGVGFVIAWLMGALPAGFGIPEGFGDIIAALGALLLIPKLRAGTASRGWLLAWNTFGLLDLISAIVVGSLYSEGAFGILSAGTPTTKLMVTFPVSLIPTFFVPLFILLHALTYRRIAALPQGK